MVLSSISQSPLGIREMSMVQNRDSTGPMKKSTTLTTVIKRCQDACGAQRIYSQAKERELDKSQRFEILLIENLPA